MNEKKTRKYTGWAAAWPMVTATLFWAGAFIAGKLSVKEFPPITLTFLRFSLATLIMIPITLKFAPDWRFPKKEWGKIFFLGLIGMVGYHLLFFASLQYTSAINSAMLAATSPLMTAILAAFFAGERLRPVQILAVFMAVGGVLTVISKGDISIIKSLNFNVGDLLMFGAVFSMAVYSVFSRRFNLSRSPLALVTATFMVCTVVTGLMIPLEGNFMVNIKNATTGAWTSVIYMSIFASCGGYFLQMFSIKRIGAAQTMVYISLVPVFSTILAILMLGEVLTVPMMAGLAVVLVAVWLNSLGK